MIKMIVLNKIKIKRILLGIFVLFAVFSIFISDKVRFRNASAKKSINAIAQEKEHYIPNGTNGVCYEYYKAKDGRWSVNGRKYNYRLILNGRMPNAAVDTEFVILTNDKNISFQDVNQSIFSNDSNDDFSPEIACIVEMR